MFDNSQGPTPTGARMTSRQIELNEPAHIVHHVGIIACIFQVCTRITSKTTSVGHDSNLPRSTFTKSLQLPQSSMLRTLAIDDIAAVVIRG